MGLAVQDRKSKCVKCKADLINDSFGQFCPNEECNSIDGNYRDFELKAHQDLFDEITKEITAEIDAEILQDLKMLN